MSKILVCGDSFAADWSLHKNGLGWPNLLATEHDVTNLAQAGCGQYKIYLQLKSISNLNDFDAIIISHTSPNRLYTTSHPVHDQSSLHANSDLLYTDIKEHSKNDKSLKSLVDYFERYFDQDYANFVHTLICKEIEEVLNDYTGKIIHITGFDWTGLYQYPNMLSFAKLAKANRGYVNHFDEEGNNKVLSCIRHRLAE